MSKFLPSFRSITSKVAGFTMIELLIVITILGILAVAVLSAINPLEQINRGRDTAAQADAEQLLGALERFNAFQERFPWEVKGTPAALGGGANGAGAGQRIDQAWLAVDVGGLAVSADCTVLDLLSSGGQCQVGANELKASYATKIDNMPDARKLFAYKADATTGSNVYVCFPPQSSAFQQSAFERCTSGVLPADFPVDMACTAAPAQDTVMTCLP